jgi:hypothetical protein
VVEGGIKVPSNNERCWGGGRGALYEDIMYILVDAMTDVVVFRRDVNSNYMRDGCISGLDGDVYYAARRYVMRDSVVILDGMQKVCAQQHSHSACTSSVG